MKKLFTYLVALVACLGISVNANAQFSADFEQEPVGYTVLEKSFPLADIATTMGVDAAALTTALQTWIATEGDAETNYFFLKTEDGLSNNYTQGGKGGFWMTKNPATPVGWTGEVGDDAWYNILSVNAEESTLVIGVGQHPDAFTAGEKVNAQFVLQFDNKEATFDVTLTIIEGETPPKPDIPDPVTDLNLLTIVGSKDVAWDQYPNMPCEQSVDIADALEVLGIDETVFADNLSSFLFMTTLELKGEDEASQKPYKTSTISNESTAGGFGFWMAHVWDDDLEAFSEECVRCYWGDHAAFRIMYSEQYSFDAATHTLNSVTGWESYSQELGTKYNFDLYIVYGDKAFKIHHVVTLTQKPEEDPNKWVKVGEEDHALELEKGEGMMTQLTLDLDVIAAALDCEVSSLKMYGPSDNQGNIDDRQTATKGGIWFSGNGVVCQWGSTDSDSSPYTFYIEPVNNMDFSTMNVGQQASNVTPNEPYKTTLFFFNGNKSDTNNKYYAVNVTITFTQQPDEFDEITVVATKDIACRVEVAPSGSWGGDTVSGVDLDELESVIGTRSPVFYSWVPTESGNEFTKEWSCTPYPGFWLTPDGYRTTWTNATDSPFGVCYNLPDGTFDIYQWIGGVGNAEGTVRKATFFLVNAATGAALQVNLSIAFGDVVNYEEVGSKDITLFADADTEHEVILVDFADAITAMGVEDVSVLLSGQSVAALTADATWSDPQMPSEGIALNDQGYFDTANTAFTIYMNPSTEGTTVEMSVDNEKGAAINPDFKLPAKLAIQRDVDGNLKQFTLNINIVSLATVGVTDVKSSDENAVIYDLSGRRSDATRKGVYIKNGKKVVK